ncbi:hypothetical protein LSUE1_G000618 [Lachnellula suecica]|uniref:Uncharacterized protein n=1 Tax=Lachnellula suecica TaxID=602035 RepID=A0A8T9CFB8_9HELO|nr:hypothetical protein LSUE1_G000618 [Lachnellula suecica]
MSSPNSSSPTLVTSPTGRARRSSKFIEGSALTGPELLQRTPTSNEHFMTILAMEDAMEQQKRQHRGSHSSVESFASNTSPTRSPTNDFSPRKEKEGRRSINFGRSSMDERPKGLAFGEIDAEKVVKKFKGRLRALTGGNARDVKPNPGT